MKNIKSSKGSSKKKPSPKKVTAKAPDEKKISSLIYCTSDLILSGILKSLDRASDIEVVNIEKSTIDSFIESIKNLRPNVIIFTNSEPLPNIREICKAIIEISTTRTKSQLLLLGNIPSHEEVVGLMNAGVRGYFDLNDPSDQLADAIRIIHKGDIWLPRDKMSSIMDRIISVVGRDLKEKTLDQLTPTEFQVLRLIGQGKSNDEIAESLFISKNTVRSHIKSIYAKLNTHSRLQLALYAINSALF
ncbi:MAG: response regulator transcription factor [Candidatus Aminicenantes bacterium]|nr:response regulator transcription factor [Candidatus Aminicenantes bacterium]MDH5706754.1 response regulator transcription factor [Candidatus Aminicenantes bacterium]